MAGDQPFQTLFESLGRLPAAAGLCVLDLVTTPISPPSGPTQWLFQGPPAESKFLAAIVAVFSLSILFAVSAMGEMREWTSSVGSKMQAEFVERVGDAVKLKTEDGSKISVRINQLSSDDQVFVANITSLDGGAATMQDLGNVTILSGVQEEPLRELTATKKPYILEGTYVVPKDAQLTIKAGTIIIAEQDAQLSVSGVIEIAGTDDSPVIFRGKATGIDYWKGIVITGPMYEVQITALQVSGAKMGLEIARGTTGARITSAMFSGNLSGLKLHGSRSGYVLDRSVFENNREHGLIVDHTKCEIQNCMFRANGIGVWRICGGPVVIERSVIADNKDMGISLWTVSGIDGQFDVHNSSIYGNKKFDVKYDGGLELDFTGNWWGESVTRRLQQKGVTVNLNSIDVQHAAGRIRLDNFLTKPPPAQNLPVR